MKNKILLCCPQLNLSGGVANFYRMLKPFFSEEIIFLQKGEGKSKVQKIFFVFLNLIRICLYLLTDSKIKTVVLNPSLGPTAVCRDMLSAFIVVKIFHRDLAVFWHGWDMEYEKEVEKTMLPRFRKTFFHAKKMFVLSSQFRKKLLEWGYKGEVVLATTCFEDCLIEKISKHPPLKGEINLLYLSRIEETKGIFIILDTFALLQKRYPGLRYKLCAAGDGGALQRARDYAAKLQLKDVDFTGYLRGDEKYKVLNQADIFFFPSYYGEGMPCALLEAMGAGLLVVTRPDGGIPDFFEQGKMGFITDSKDPEVFADAIAKIVQNHPDGDFYSNYNRQYAQTHFTASHVAEFLQNELGAVSQE